MTRPERAVPRQDLVVILARGDSRRMGSPKGLLRCPGTVAETFVGAIARGYGRLGLACLVVTTPELGGAHAAAVAGVPSCRVATHPGGGATGRTVWLGWREAPPGTTHLWAHPVDLPLVTEATLRTLLAASESSPERVLRPVFDRRPGHPVVLPTRVLRRLGESPDWQHASMSAILGGGTEGGKPVSPLLLPLSDEGVVRDFDAPTDLET